MWNDQSRVSAPLHGWTVFSFISIVDDSCSDVNEISAGLQETKKVRRAVHFLMRASLHFAQQAKTGLPPQHAKPARAGDPGLLEQLRAGLRRKEGLLFALYCPAEVVPDTKTAENRESWYIITTSY